MDIFNNYLKVKGKTTIYTHLPRTGVYKAVLGRIKNSAVTV